MSLRGVSCASLLVVGAVVGCGGDKEDTGPEVVVGGGDGFDDVDGDGDGYTEAMGDCDDTDPSISPAAEEVYGDGVDQDCDGRNDSDADGDGYGVPEDCDDTDPSVNPAAEEIWYDGVDQDCNGRSDYDADGDTWDDGEDCNDADPDISPDAPEICDDGIDNNCDGAITGCGIWQDQSVAAADGVLYGDAGGDRLGQGDPGVAVLGDIDGDGSLDVAVSAIFESSVAERQGAVYVVSGAVTGTENIGNVAGVKLTGDDAGDYHGYAVAGAGDLNNDGIPDLAVGAIRDDTAGTDAGITFVLYGPVDESADLATRADSAWTGEAAGDISGEVAFVGDFDGDGLADLLVGAQYHSDRAGAAYLLLGPASAGGSLSSAALVLRGVEAADEASSSLSGVGDTDGDGYADLMIAAKAAGSAAGAAYLVLGGERSGTVNLSAADAIFEGEAVDDELGYGVSVAGAGDVNGDGYDDVVLGAHNNDQTASNAGAAYVLLGPLDAGTFSIASADARLYGETAADYTGDSVACAGDVDGDGNDDILVGSGYSDLGALEGGATYLVRGPMTGTLSLASADGILRAEAEQDRLRVRGGGDLDGDGRSDVLVTAQLADDGDEVDAGALYWFRGAGL